MACHSNRRHSVQPVLECKSGLQVLKQLFPSHTPPVLTLLPYNSLDFSFKYHAPRAKQTKKSQRNEHVNTLAMRGQPEQKLDGLRLNGPAK
ncbi:hypothetical protein VTH06DRAFT_4356 [Thermothelomyces fergusii]